MKKRKILFVTVVIVVIFLAAAMLMQLFMGMRKTPPKRPAVEYKRHVKAEPVQYSEVTSSVEANGRVVSGNEVMLVAEAAGKLETGSVRLKKGTSFKKGDLLVSVYKDETELALKARKSRFLTTFSNMLPDMKVDYPEDYEHFYTFFNSINIDNDFPEFPEIAAGKLKIFLSSRQVLSEYYGILQDEMRLKRHSLYAPFNGSFTQVNSEVGAYVNPGSQIARMICTDLLEVEIPVENIHSNWINVGDEVTLYSKGRQNVRTGKVVRKSDFVEMGTQSRSIFVKVKNSAKNPLLAGEYMHAEFSGQKIDDAMEMPRSAVFNTNEVFVVEEGRIKIVQINIVKVNDKTLIFNGLEEGVQLVIEPLVNAKENAPVEIMQN